MKCRSSLANIRIHRSTRSRIIELRHSWEKANAFSSKNIKTFFDCKEDRAFNREKTYNFLSKGLSTVQQEATRGEVSYEAVLVLSLGLDLPGTQLSVLGKNPHENMELSIQKKENVHKHIDILQQLLYSFRVDPTLDGSEVRYDW